MRRRIFYEIIKKCQRNVVDMSTNPRVTSVECSTVVDFFRFFNKFYELSCDIRRMFNGT